jgi:hypothetical protein
MIVITFHHRHVQLVHLSFAFEGFFFFLFGFEILSCDELALFNSAK